MNKTEHLLACLIEECAEVQKVAAKALRFGLDDHAPDEPTLSNSESIANECTDLLAIMEMLESENIIPPFQTHQSIQMKKDKVIKYMEYARERGTLLTEDTSIQFAVKALIFNDNSFLALHKKSIKSEKMELPGGKLQFGESAELTVIREVLEETGLDVKPVALVDTWNYVTESTQITGIIYLCKAENLNNIVLSDEHDHYEWLATDSDSIEKMNRLFKPQMLKWDWDYLIKCTTQ